MDEIMETDDTFEYSLIGKKRSHPNGEDNSNATKKHITCAQEEVAPCHNRTETFENVQTDGIVYSNLLVQNNSADSGDARHQIPSFSNNNCNNDIFLQKQHVPYFNERFMGNSSVATPKEYKDEYDFKTYEVTQGIPISGEQDDEQKSLYDETTTTEIPERKRAFSLESRSTIRFFVSMLVIFVFSTISTFVALGVILLPQESNKCGLTLLTMIALVYVTMVASYPFAIGISNHPTISPKDNPQVILPSEAKGSVGMMNKLSNVTLRQFLSHSDGFHLGLAPSFFGFYVYFGALTAFHENVLTDRQILDGKLLLPVGLHNSKGKDVLLKSTAGASSGAMAAVLLASGMNPREAADFASSMTLDKFADFPGVGGIFKGDLFEQIMVDRIKANANTDVKDESMNLRLEDGIVPVAVTGFDITTWKGKILTKGCMGKAARASATFPGLFQPCKWDDAEDNYTRPSYLIDGALRDSHGLVGLTALHPDMKKKRVVNMIAGSFSDGVIGPSDVPNGLDVHEILSISIENAPQCGPWAMQNGPRAVVAAREAIKSVLDLPLYKGKEDGHYVLHVDCRDFIPNIVSNH